MNLLEENRQKLRELQQIAQWAADRWLEECFAKGAPFKVLEVSRAQSRQDKLILKGRKTADDFWKDVASGKMTKATAVRGIALLKQFGPGGGSKVTYTLDSLHTKNLAADIAPLNGDHRRIAEIGKKYGITHPLSFDPPHYQFDQAKQQPPPTFSVEAQIKRLARLAARTKGLVRRSYQRGLKRLRSRFWAGQV